MGMRGAMDMLRRAEEKAEQVGEGVDVDAAGCTSDVEGWSAVGEMAVMQCGASDALLNGRDRSS